MKKTLMSLAMAVLTLTACQGDSDLSCPVGTLDTGNNTISDVALDSATAGDLPDGGRDVLTDASGGFDLGDIQILPGEFGAPCDSNEDCDSGFCIEGPEGSVCTKTCVEDCPDNWTCRSMQIGSDLVSVCIPQAASLCKPCRLDTQCSGGLCLDIGGSTFCSYPCVSNDCPDGYECTDIEGIEDEDQAKQCLPKTGACDCNTALDGVKQPCVITNEFGTCLGFERCDANQGWVECSATVPAEDTCNGSDDDCNGVVDDLPGQPTENCTIDIPDVGSCTGSWVCQGEGGWACVGAEPKPETCNYIDDDCDTNVDEDFKDAKGRYATLVHCGQCNNDCSYAIPFATETACDVTGDTSKCIVIECAPLYSLTDEGACVPQTSSLCLPCLNDENCGGEGDLCLAIGTGKFCGRDCGPDAALGDCPTNYQCQEVETGSFQCIPETGSCDCGPENAGLQRVCSRVNTFGTCFGTETCDPVAGFSGCTARIPAEEICNGFDDDCDGFADELLDEPTEACANSWTDPDSGTQYTCTAPWMCDESGEGTKWLCNAETPKVETCNYHDDNCDGDVDEDWPQVGAVCFSGSGACQTVGIVRCLEDESGAFCDGEPGSPSDELCDGIDNDCDNAIDEEWPGKGNVCSFGVGACRANGVLVCNETGTALVCNAVPNSDSPETCNSIDDDCDGDIDEDWPSLGTVCTSGKGVCRTVGLFQCLEDTTGVECSAQEGPAGVESCNGLDDDCDGATDENWPNLGTVCVEGLGQCRTAGVWQCLANGSGLDCSASAGVATAETCDYLDNDCDGQTDEKFKVDGVFSANNACGNCFTDCTAIWNQAEHNANGVCMVAPSGPLCAFECVDGFVNADQNPDNGCELEIDPLAVYVATPNNGGLESDDCGTYDGPCAKIGQAIAIATSEGKLRVLVSEGIYAESITLIAGIDVLGGYSAATWKRNPGTSITIIQGTTENAATVQSKRAVYATWIEEPTTFSGFTVYGENNYYTDPYWGTGSSYAIFVANCTSDLIITDNIVYAGRGSSALYGTNGTTGSNGGNGGDGSDGFVPVVGGFCTTETGNGGNYGASECEAEGGGGATARCPNMNAQQEDGGNGDGTVFGQGGTGGYDSYVNQDIRCSTAYTNGENAAGLPGANGGNGPAGTAGPGCDDNGGVILFGNWAPTQGNPGTNGASGSGGGGGGAGGGVDIINGSCSNGETIGGAGGGGGAGGCGGIAGAGGAGGGGSFGIFVFAGADYFRPVIENNYVVRNNGGAGGAGGNGGNGGVGGLGGEGGTVDGLGYAWATGIGGRGGAGGLGGAGGGGGGGCGGVSYGIYVFGMTTDPNYCDPGAASGFDAVGGGGAGGPGGNSASAPGTNGLHGDEADCKIKH